MPILYQGEGSVKLFGDRRIERRQFRAEKTMPMKTDRNPETLETGDLQIMRTPGLRKKKTTRKSG